MAALLTDVEPTFLRDIHVTNHEKIWNVHSVVLQDNAL